MSRRSQMAHRHNECAGAEEDTFMSRLANDDAGAAMPVLAVIVAVIFIAVLFFKFVEMVGPSSGSGSSAEVGKATSSVR
jgi:hypothetical protein